jgi:beta-exotoxin I transport system ATP-binding protein
MMTTEYAIITKGLIKNYGKVQALRGVDLDVSQGEIFGFLGPNGAGKTTTIRCMLDLIRPQGGSIRVLGLDPQEDPVAVRAQVGYLPGELSLEDNLKVEALLRYFVGLRKNHVDWKYVEELAERLQLDLSVQIKNLSKGNKQKVGVVQALMAKPRLLLLDEPTAGLDPLVQQEVYRLLREAREYGASIFFSSHIISEVEAIAERVAIIRKGVIVQEAKPSQLVNFAMRKVHIRFLEPVDATRLKEIPGVSILSTQNGNAVSLRVEGEMDGLIKALRTYPVSDFETERASLEEVFLAYYKAGAQEGD